jgi:hypothetical protein
MARRRTNPGATGPILPIASFVEALRHAGSRPAAGADRDAKKNYSERLSNAIAVLLASKLRSTGQFPLILPAADGTGRETRSMSGAGRKFKKTDVRYATADTGLELLVSIKTLNFRDDSSGRYTKNMVRNDHELRAEAMDHHERFPFAVLVGVFFLPVDACDDGASDKSSFAHAVLTFRPRTGRAGSDDTAAKFERFFVGLYDAASPSDDRVGFFDVLDAPPRRGRPPWPNEAVDPAKGGRLLSLEQMILQVVRDYGVRTRTYIRWADEAEESVSMQDTSVPASDGSE